MNARPFRSSALFHDSRLLAVADLKHSESEERWFSVGCATNGAVLSVICLWTGADPAAKGS